MTERSEEQKMWDAVEEVKKKELEDIAKKSNPHKEAPAVCWFKFVLDGFETSLTLRGESGADLLKKIRQAMVVVKDMGGHGMKGAPASTGLSTAKICPKHKVPMKQMTKDGKSWYAHKTEDPDYEKGWCNGK
jgi:hypothetical protein